MLVFIIGLILFFGTHSIAIVAPEWRDRQMETMGLVKWRGLYSIASIITLIILIWGYSMARHEAAILYVAPLWMSHLTALLMLFAMILLFVSNFPAGKIKPAVKHPLLASIKIWAFSHLLVNGDIASIMLFGSFLAWAVIDRISLKKRNAAIAAPGPVKWDIMAIVTGIVVYVLFVWKLHYWLIGVEPVTL